MRRILLLVTASTSLISAGEPSVNYIQAPQGNFFGAVNKTLHSSDIDFVMPTKSRCQCRNQCFVRPSCKIWSVVPVNDTALECRMSDSVRTNFTFAEGENTSVFFPEDIIDGTYFLMPDLLLYLRPNVNLSFSEAKDFCERIPGHRLSIYKTMLQWNSISSQMDSDEPYYVLDLHKQPDGRAIWGDGTPFEETEMGDQVRIENAHEVLKIYIYYHGRLDDAMMAKTRRFFCQANPNGVEW